MNNVINTVSKELDEHDLKVQIKLKTNHIQPVPGIYMIVHTKSGKTYVGSSKNVLKRMSQHIVSLFNNKHHSYKLQNLFNQHGLGSFTFVMLQQCEIEDLFTVEQHHIDSIPTRRRLNVNKKADGSDYLQRRKKRKAKPTTKPRRKSVTTKT